VWSVLILQGAAGAFFWSKKKPGSPPLLGLSELLEHSLGTCIALLRPVAPPTSSTKQATAFQHWNSMGRKEGEAGRQGQQNQ